MRERLSWFISNAIPNVILALVDSDQVSTHVVAVVQDTFNRLVLTYPEEYNALPFNRMALDFCTGPNQTITGIGQAYTVTRPSKISRT